MPTTSIDVLAVNPGDLVSLMDANDRRRRYSVLDTFHGANGVCLRLTDPALPGSDYDRHFRRAATVLVVR